MATIVLIGSDAALLEGLAQTLAASGHRACLAATLAEARDMAETSRPLVAVVERALAVQGSEVLGLALAPGGALVLYRTSASAESSLSAPLQRATLANLTLPLERQRLVALIQSVEERSRLTGRSRHPTPPEARAIDAERKT